MNYEEEIKKVEWQYLVSRRESLLFKSITDCGYQYFEKVIGIPWLPTRILRLDEGDILHSAKELNKLRSIFLKEGVEFFTQFRDKLVFHVEVFDKMVRKIENTDCSKLTKDQLAKLMNDYFESDLQIHNFLLPFPVADKVLSKMILALLPDAPEQQKQEWLATLTYPTKENEHTKEERSFCNLAKKYRDKDFDSLVDEHLKNFAWIGMRGYWWHFSWKKEDILERLENFSAQNKNPETELENLDSSRKERIAAAEKLMEKLDIKPSSSSYKLIHLAKEYAYLRTWRTDILYGAGYRARGLFFEVAKRAGFKEDDLPYITFAEVLEMAKTGKPPVSADELAKRKEYSAFFTIDNQHKVLSGKEWQRKMQSIFKEELAETGEIKGNIAFHGKVQGQVKIVFTADDLKKVKQGDILVAVMTFPHFVPAMEKAAAFVTDEGGILCHAAIVSREMKKPCIIATRTATKIFKDGDLVEVDADKGIVRKIK
jgi:phosphohistidine swiveling domain-containing protein